MVNERRTDGLTNTISSSCKPYGSDEQHIVIG